MRPQAGSDFYESAAGFPGETDEDFEHLLEFLEEAQLDRVGCFAYSPVEGAKANELDNPVPEELMQERLQRFMEPQAAISAKRLQAKVGKRQDVVQADEHDLYGQIVGE